MKDEAETFPSSLLCLDLIWVVGSRGEGGSLASLFTNPLSLSPCKSTAASGASGVGDTINFILKANSLLVQSVGFLFRFGFLNTCISACISKTNLDLSVGGRNHQKACQSLLNSKAAKLKLVMIFLNRMHKRFYFEYFFLVSLLY